MHRLREVVHLHRMRHGRGQITRELKRRRMTIAKVLAAFAAACRVSWRGGPPRCLASAGPTCQSISANA